jgi:hypothetical protein
MMNESTAANIGTVTSVGLFGVSLAQVEQWLHITALVLTVIATAITIGVHVHNWTKKRRGKKS